MLFYINSVSAGARVEVELSSQHIFTKDKTLDSANVVLECRTTKNPYAPMQKFIVIFDDNTRQDYYIVNDLVELYSNTPLRYKHTLTLTQNTRALSKRLLRNSVFSQPANPEKRLYFAVSNYEDENGHYKSYVSSVGYFNWCEPLILGKNERVKNVYLIMKGYATGVDLDDPTDETFYTWFNTSQFFPDNYPIKFILTYTDKNGEVTIQNLYFNNNVALGEKLYSSSTIDAMRPSINFTNFFKNVVTNGGNVKIDISGLATPQTDRTFASDTKTTKDNDDLIVQTLQLEFFIETYTYTAYDVLNTIVKQLRQKYTLRQFADIFTLPQEGSDLYRLLINTIAPNFTFTQSTVFDAIAEVFNLFDATFTLSPSKELEIEYLNEANKQQIADNTFVGFTETHAETNYSNSLISFYQDARTTELFPSEKGYSGVRFSEYGIPNNKNTREFALPHKIDYINRIQTIIRGFNVKNFHYAGNNANFTNQWFPVDITPFVVESTIYGNLPFTTNFPYPNYDYLSQLATSNAIYFTKGTNFIQIGGTYKDWLNFEYITFWNVLRCALYRFFGFCHKDVTGANGYVSLTYPLSENWNDLRFNVEYLTSVDGVTKVHSLDNKYNGEEIINQVNGAVDLNKLGLNMLGLSLKLGQPTMACKHQISNWNDRIQKGQLYIKDGEYWVANVCTYTTLGNGYYLGNIEFSKNFNALSQRINLNREKRFTNISSNLICKSEEILSEYLYYASGYDDTTTADTISMPTNNISHYLTWTFGDLPVTPKLICDATILSDDDTYVAIPLHKYNAGNSINFEIAYTDPLNAGNKTSQKTINNISTYYTEPTLYTDSEGFLEKTTIKYGNAQTNDLGFGNYPTISITDYAKIEDYEFYKKPNEIFAFNYQIVMLPRPDRLQTDFIGQEFMKNCALLFNKINDGVREFYFICKPANSTFKYSILDTKADYDVLTDTRIKVLTIISTTINGKIKITFQLPTTHGETNAWAICDKDDNIYFASNWHLSNNNYAEITFSPRLTRIED